MVIVVVVVEDVPMTPLFVYSMLGAAVTESLSILVVFVVSTGLDCDGVYIL